MALEVFLPPPQLKGTCLSYKAALVTLESMLWGSGLLRLQHAGTTRGQRYRNEDCNEAPDYTVQFLNSQVAYMVPVHVWHAFR